MISSYGVHPPRSSAPSWQHQPQQPCVRVVGGEGARIAGPQPQMYVLAAPTMTVPSPSVHHHHLVANHHPTAGGMMMVCPPPQLLSQGLVNSSLPQQQVAFGLPPPPMATASASASAAMAPQYVLSQGPNMHNPPMMIMQQQQGVQQQQQQQPSGGLVWVNPMLFDPSSRIVPPNAAAPPGMMTSPVYYAAVNNNNHNHPALSLSAPSPTSYGLASSLRGPASPVRTVPVSTSSIVVTPPHTPHASTIIQGFDGSFAREARSGSRHPILIVGGGGANAATNAASARAAGMVNPMDLLANVATAVDHLDGSTAPGFAAATSSTGTARSVSTSTSGSGASSSSSSAARPPASLMLMVPPPVRPEPQEDRPRRVSMEHSVVSITESSADGSEVLRLNDNKNTGRKGGDNMGRVGGTTVPTLLDVVVVVSSSSANQGDGAEEDDINDDEDEDADNAVQHIGNEFYRKVIQLNAARYADCTNNHEKSFVVRSVVDGFERHGTRFLKRRLTSSPARYVTISRKAAYRHVKRSLRIAVHRMMKTEQQRSDEETTRRMKRDAKAKAASAAAWPTLAAPTPAPTHSWSRKNPPRPRLDNPVPFGEKAQPTLAPRSVEQSGPRPIQPHPNDVVFGRGNNIANHPGNLLFRQFVLHEKDSYGAAPRQVKALIARRVVEKVLKLCPPGRFLEMGDDGRYYDVDPQRVFEKTCQACRERKWSRSSAARSTSGPSPPDREAAVAAAALSGRDSPYEWYGEKTGGGAAAAMAEHER